MTDQLLELLEWLFATKKEAWIPAWSWISLTQVCNWKLLIEILLPKMTDAPVSITEPGLEKLPRKSDQKTLISRPRASVASRKVGQADHPQLRLLIW